MRPRFPRWLVVSWIGAFCVITACSVAEEAPEDWSTLPASSRVYPTVAPTDKRMLAALLPEFRGVRRDSPKVRTALERLMDEPRPGGPFLGEPGVGGCARWLSGLRRAARGVAAKAGTGSEANISGRTFDLGRGQELAVALLVAEPGLISALGAGGPDRCGSGEVRSQGVVTPVRIRLRPHHSGLGFPTVAYSYEPVGRDATRRRWRTWVKEVRYGGYMLQVALTERLDEAVRGGGPELRRADLDDATGQADQRSGRVFRANPASRALADGAEDDVQYALMRSSWSGLKEDAETGGRQRGSAGSLAFPQGVPERFLREAALPNVHQVACRPWASGLWQAAMDRIGSDRRQDEQAAYWMTTVEDHSFGVHTVVRSRPEVHRYLRTLALPGSCTSFRHSMNGTPVTVRAEALDAVPIGDSSRAIKITTSDGDAPTYVRWFSIGPYLNEVRVGTVGTTDSKAVTQRHFDAFARKAYEAAQDNVP